MSVDRLLRCSDLDLVKKYNQGDVSCGVILFEKYKSHLDMMSRNSVDLGISNIEGKMGIAYYAFVRAFSGYEGRNGSSFKTYISRCVRNAFLSEKRKQKAKKRNRGRKPVSINNEIGMRELDDSIYSAWNSFKRNS